MTERERDETFDLQLQDFLAWQASDTASAPTATDVAARDQLAPRGDDHGIAARAQPHVVGPGEILLTATLLGLGMIGARLLLPRPISGATNGWIAFSTQRGCCEVGHDYNGVGGDIYLVRDGIDAKVIVSRGPGNASNVSPPSHLTVERWCTAIETAQAAP